MQEAGAEALLAVGLGVRGSLRDALHDAAEAGGAKEPLAFGEGDVAVGHVAGFPEVFVGHGGLGQEFGVA
jgi:hypothetical protein